MDWLCVQLWCEGWALSKLQLVKLNHTGHPDADPSDPFPLLSATAAFLPPHDMRRSSQHATLSGSSSIAS